MSDRSIGNFFGNYFFVWVENMLKIRVFTAETVMVRVIKIQGQKFQGKGVHQIHGILEA